ncbi:hypothetical protein PENARI_c024G04705, partial [Penicillium arizonense]
VDTALQENLEASSSYLVDRLYPANTRPLFFTDIY